jgi:hypothetical protein
MARTPTLASASRIRIEDEVWEQAFSSRVPARGRPARAHGDAPPARTRQISPEVTLRVVSDDAPPPGARRTVRIQGRGADPYRPVNGRPRPSAAARPVHTGSSPDRLAMWATLLGFLLVLVAALSSHL